MDAAGRAALIDVRDYAGAACPECGAPAADGLNCWWQMGAICAWEADDPALAALHFHTVATFNLQHPAQFMDDALVGLETRFREAIDEDLGAAEIRRRTGQAWDGARRVIRPVADRRPALRTWPRTVADAYAHGTPAGAAERVLAWARAVRDALDGPPTG